MLANEAIRTSKMFKNKYPECEDELFMIFTVVFKVMICKTTYRKLTDKKLEGSLEVSDITAKMVKPL